MLNGQNSVDMHCSTLLLYESVLLSLKEPPSSSIWPHLSYGLVRSKREYYH